MHHQCETVVRCAAGTSEPFAVEVGLYQGSAFSPFLFAIMMDSLPENISKEAPWQMLEVTEMKMCRWACGHTLRDHVRNDDIREKLKVENITERCRKARLRLFGHVKRRDQEYVGRKTLEMVPPGRRKRGRPKQRWMDCVNRDMRASGMTKTEVHDRTGWRSPMTELAGGELCLPQRPHNQVGAARRRINRFKT